MKTFQQRVFAATPVLLMALWNAGHAATSLPITVTGYNTDVVFEIGGTPGSAGKFLNEDQALYESGLGGASGSGLPTTASGRTLISDYTVGVSNQTLSPRLQIPRVSAMIGWLGGPSSLW